MTPTRLPGIDDYPIRVGSLRRAPPHVILSVIPDLGAFCLQMVTRFDDVDSVQSPSLSYSTKEQGGDSYCTVRIARVRIDAAR